MDADDKVKNKADEVAGAMKEKTGRATGDERLEKEGKAERAKAEGKQVVDHVSDKAEDVAENARDALRREREQ